MTATAPCVSPFSVNSPAVDEARRLEQLDASFATRRAAERSWFDPANTKPKEAFRLPRACWAPRTASWAAAAVIGAVDAPVPTIVAIAPSARLGHRGRTTPATGTLEPVPGTSGLSEHAG